LSTNNIPLEKLEKLCQGFKKLNLVSRGCIGMIFDVGSGINLGSNIEVYIKTVPSN
jgi:hypothetical protein